MSGISMSEQYIHTSGPAAGVQKLHGKMGLSMALVKQLGLAQAALHSSYV